MRIAMVAEFTEQVAGLSAALAARGHEVTVYCRLTDPAGARAARGYRVVSVPVGPAGALAPDEVSRALHMAWSRDRPDVVHTQTWFTAPAALDAATRHGIPVVHTVRLDGARTEAEHPLTHAADQVTTTCAAHADVLIGDGVARARISVVPDGIDVAVFRPEGDRARRGTAHRLVALGHEGPHAGLSTAVAALCGLPNAELVIAGEVADGLRRYAERLGVAGRVHGTRQDLPALLRSADVVVATPWHDPWNGAALEAMACGTAVVATPVGPLSDTVVDRVTGLFVPPRRPRDLARAIQRLLARTSVREQYGAAAADRVSARYTWDRIATEALSVYARAGAPAGVTRTVTARRGQPIGAWH